MSNNKSRWLRWNTSRQKPTDAEVGPQDDPNDDVAVETDSTVYEIQGGPGDMVYCASFSPSGHLIAIGFKNHEVKMYATDDKSCLASFRLNDYCWCVRFTPDGKFVLASDASGFSTVYDLESNQVLHECNNGPEKTWCIAASADSKWFASAGSSGVIIVRNVIDAQEVKRIDPVDPVKKEVTTLLFSADGKWLISACQDGTIYVRDVHSDAIISKFVFDKGEWAMAVDLTSDSRLIAVSTTPSNNVTVYDFQTQKEMYSYKHKERVNNLKFSADNQYLTSGSWDTFVVTTRVFDGAEVSRIKYTGRIYNTVCYSPDGWVASGGLNNKLTVRLTVDYQKVKVFNMRRASFVLLLLASSKGHPVLSAVPVDCMRVIFGFVMTFPLLPDEIQVVTKNK